MEINLIKKYRKIKNQGILSNITDGGEGWKGGEHSKESIRKMSEKLTKIRNTPEYKRERSKIAKELCQNEAHREKIKKGVKKYYKENPEKAKAHKNRQKEKMKSKQMRQKMSERMKKYYIETPDSYEKNSQALKKYYIETSGAITKNKRAAKKAMNDPKTREKMSKSAKKRFEKMLPGEWGELQKKKLNDPKTREKMSQSAKNRKIKKICKRCQIVYYKKAINKFNKDFCDSCRLLQDNEQVNQQSEPFI